MTSTNFTNDNSDIRIFPSRLNFGLISQGYVYNLKFSIQNNSQRPITVRIQTESEDGEKNYFRVSNAYEKIAPGVSIPSTLELTAQSPSSSRYTITITSDSTQTQFKRIVEANVITPQTFRYVKKFLELQKKPLHKSNIKSVGKLNTLDRMPSMQSVMTTFTENLLMDDEDIDDLMEFPVAPNCYWDPKDKVMRVDPEAGKVHVSPSITLEEAKLRTKDEWEERMMLLEEQGFITYQTFESLRFQYTSNLTNTNSFNSTFSGMGEVSESESFNGSFNGTGELSGSSLKSKTSTIPSMVSMKREKIERQRKASIVAALQFAESSKTDTMVDGNRTLAIIEQKQKSSKYSKVK